jgi:hypothetical protein
MVVLAVVLPKANGTDLVGTAIAEGEAIAARAAERKPGWLAFVPGDVLMKPGDLACEFLRWRLLL